MARKERKYHYIYKITCLKNEKYYIGMHSTDNLEDGYMGGGKRIKNSVRKHGKDVHRKEILEFFESREDLINGEIQLVNEELLNDSMCMNLNLGGEGDIRWTSESRRNGALAANEINWKNPEFIEKMKSVGRKTFKKLWLDPICREKLIESSGNAFRGKHHTDESKEKIGKANSIKQKGSSNSQYGKIWMYNDDLKINKKIEDKELENMLNSGYKKGMKMEYFTKSNQV
jgi:hypothetical protein